MVTVIISLKNKRSMCDQQSVIFFHNSPKSISDLVEYTMYGRKVGKR